MLTEFVELKQLSAFKTIILVWFAPVFYTGVIFLELARVFCTLQLVLLLV
ncbi:hypothetical protein GCM10007978_44980 [Shewanella hanedai]|nr:hypothetical protein GCM10007978_44980 [Shewanella hanedai]